MHNMFILFVVFIIFTNLKTTTMKPPIFANTNSVSKFVMEVPRLLGVADIRAKLKIIYV